MNWLRTTNLHHLLVQLFIVPQGEICFAVQLNMQGTFKTIKTMTSTITTTITVDRTADSWCQMKLQLTRWIAIRMNGKKTTPLIEQYYFDLVPPSHSSAQQHDDVGQSRLHASPAEQYAAQPSGYQHCQHTQRKCEFHRHQGMESRSVDLCGMRINESIPSDVSVLHEWAAISRIPVSYLNLPARPPAGVLSIPNRTTGSKAALCVIKSIRFFFFFFFNDFLMSFINE